MITGRQSLVGAALIVGLCAATSASGQVNIEQLRRDSVVRRLSGSLETDLSVRTGNVDLIKLGASARLDYAINHFRTFVIVRGDYGWESGESFSNEVLLHFRQLFRTEDRVKPEFFEQLNYDKARRLTFRMLFGGGLRFTLMRRGGSRLWFGTAYMYEREHLDLTAGAVHPDRTSTHRWTSYLSSRILVTEQATLIWSVYIQPAFDDPDDTRVLTDVKFGTRVSRSLSLVTSFQLRADSDPPDEVKSVDTTLKTGLTIEF